MNIRIFKAVDSRHPEFIARVWEDDFPTILFHFLGESAEEVISDASAFWEREIEPKRKQREQSVINREEGRRRAAITAAKKKAKESVE